MLKNYIKIAWRNFLGNKSYSLINVGGLATGLACLILIMLFVADELSYDKFHDGKEQIYIMAIESSFGGGLSTPYPLGPILQEEIPEIENFVITIQQANPGRVSLDGENYVDEEQIVMASDEFFNVFSFALKTGDPSAVLANPSSVVITESMAQKYFGSQNPVGEIITIERQGIEEYTVTGVAEDMTNKSFLNFNFVTSIQNNSSVISNRDVWGSRMFHTYVKLQAGASGEDIELKLAEVAARHLGPESNTSFFMIPLTQLYMSDLSMSDGFKGSMEYIYIFSAIALFILFLACINYMNLATARGSQRAREVGIRKVVGAEKKQLILQFLGEALIVTFFAFLAGLLIAATFLPWFNSFVGKELTLDVISNYRLLLLLLGISLLAGLFAGSYPALFLSRFTPSSVLKGNTTEIFGKSGLRKSLVVAQFAISTILIAGTIVAMQQLRYVMEKDLGFQGEQVMVIPANQIEDRIETFKQTVLNHSGVLHAASASGVPGNFWLRVHQNFDSDNPDHLTGAYLVRADADYQDVMGLELAAGRYFDENRSDDRDNARLINETMVNELNWGTPEEAVGRTFSDGSELIGVFKDFHFQSLHSQISSVFFQMKPTNANAFQGYSMIAIRFIPEQIHSLIPYLEEEWNDLGTTYPMNHHFLNDQFAELYETDKKLGLAFSVFAGTAIFIACLGLFGLTIFSAEQRTKEIGVRKVLGASVASIVALLSKDFIKLVVIGFVIAVPIAWYAMNRWLEDFAYRIEIGPGIFALAGTLALVIALLTVSGQSIKAALMNPVDSLRNE